MSTDECKAGFSREERGKFLDEKLVKALDRIEQEAVLRIAGLADLVTCPFCPYAAEYPPIEQDKEFRCLNSECQTVSCRHCKSKTHIPMSCEESARETGYSGRRKIEEAMSAALIRKCNKCLCQRFSCPRGCLLILQQAALHSSRRTVATRWSVLEWSVRMSNAMSAPSPVGVIPISTIRSGVGRQGIAPFLMMSRFVTTMKFRKPRQARESGSPLRIPRYRPSFFVSTCQRPLSNNIHSQGNTNINVSWHWDNTPSIHRWFP